MQSPPEIPAATPLEETEHTAGVDDWKELAPPPIPAEFVTEIEALSPDAIVEIGEIVKV